MSQNGVAVANRPNEDNLEAEDEVEDEYEYGEDTLEAADILISLAGWTDEPMEEGEEYDDEEEYEDEEEESSSDGCDDEDDDDAAGRIPAGGDESNSEDCEDENDD